MENRLLRYSSKHPKPPLTISNPSDKSQPNQTKIGLPSYYSFLLHQHPNPKSRFVDKDLKFARNSSSAHSKVKKTDPRILENSNKISFEKAFSRYKSKNSQSECHSVMGESEIAKYLQESLMANQNRPQTSQAKFRQKKGIVGVPEKSRKSGLKTRIGNFAFGDNKGQGIQKDSKAKDPKIGIPKVKSAIAPILKEKILDFSSSSHHSSLDLDSVKNEQVFPEEFGQGNPSKKGKKMFQEDFFKGNSQFQFQFQEKKEKMKIYVSKGDLEKKEKIHSSAAIKGNKGNLENKGKVPFETTISADFLSLFAQTRDKGR